MMSVIVSAAFVVWALLSSATVHCHDDLKAGELSKDIIDQINHIQNNRVANFKQDCQTLQEIQLDFYLYNRDDYNNPIPLDPMHPKRIDPSKKTVLIIHGWLQTSNASSILNLKRAYLDRYDCNVVIVDWSEISMQVYTAAYCHMQRMGIQVSRFLCNIHSQLGMPMKEVHMVGYSLGGQLAGVTGQHVKSKCKQHVGRITGLDPAGPLFQNLPARRRLDKSDAMFVDVIHTDQLKFGYSGNTGHLDFYPNCGQVQPGCTTVRDILDNSTVAEILCSHHRSLDYMIESVDSDHFVGVSCGMCPRYCRPNIISEVYAVMGEGASPMRDNKFYLTTKNVPPFGEGWTLHSAKLP